MYGVEGAQRPTDNGERSSDERHYARGQLDFGGAGAMDHAGAVKSAGVDHQLLVCCGGSRVHSFALLLEGSVHVSR